MSVAVVIAAVFLVALLGILVLLGPLRRWWADLDDQTRRTVTVSAVGALLAVIVAVTAGIYSVSREEVPRPSPIKVPDLPVTLLTPTYTGSAVHRSNAPEELWDLTERIEFPANQLSELYDAVREAIREQPKRAEFIARQVQRLGWIAGTHTAGTDPDGTIYIELTQMKPGYYSERLRYLYDLIHRIDDEWSADWHLGEGIVILTPTVDRWNSQTKVNKFLVQQFLAQGWKKRQKGTDIEFVRSQVWKTYVPNSLSRVTVTHELSIGLPHNLRIPGVQRLNLEPAKGSQLVLSARKYIISSTSPPGQTQVGADTATIVIDLSLPPEAAHIRVKMLIPRWRNDLGERLADLTIWKIILYLFGLYLSAAVLTQFIVWVVKRIFPKKQKPSTLGD